MVGNAMMQYSLVDALKKVEQCGDELVAGHCAGDVRDAVVIVAAKVAKLKQQPNWKRPPCWTLREMWAADLVLRALGAALEKAGDGDGREG